MSYLGSRPPLQVNHGYGTKKQQRLPPLPSGFRVPDTSSLDEHMLPEAQEPGGLSPAPKSRESWEREARVDKPITLGHPDPWQRVAQLEKALQFVKEQQAIMLRALHQEVDALKQKNRDLQMKLVLKEESGKRQSKNGSGIHDTEVEALERQLDDLKKALREEQAKNLKMNSVLEDYKRREKDGGPKKPTLPAPSYSTQNLTEAQQTINGLRQQLQQLQSSVASRLHPQAIKPSSSNGQRTGTSNTDVLRRTIDASALSRRMSEPQGSNGHLPKIPQKSLPKRMPSVPSTSSELSNLPSIAPSRGRVTRSSTSSPDIPLDADPSPSSPRRSKGRASGKTKSRK